MRRSLVALVLVLCIFTPMVENSSANTQNEILELNSTTRHIIHRGETIEASITVRNLAEQIHGLKVEGNTTVIDLMVQNDTFRGIVSGTIRGARTVRINPTGSDTYEVLLEIDKDTLSYLLREARGVA